MTVSSYFYSENSSFGESYLCEKYENQTFDFERCFFIYHKQLRNADQFYLSVIEGVILIILSLSIIPANICALRNFSQRQLTPDFQLLLNMLCFYNFSMAFVGIVIGASRFTTDFPLGFFGCVLFKVGAGTINTCTAYTLTWLSIERRRVICTTINSSKTFLPRRKTASLLTIMVVVLTVLLSLSLWCFVLFKFNLHQIHPYDRGDGGVGHVCVTKPYLMGNVGIGGLLFSMVTFLAPLVIALFNFGYANQTITFKLLFFC